MIRFYGGKVLSLKENFNITDDEVWVKDGKIEYVGKEKNIITRNRGYDCF